MESGRVDTPSLHQQGSSQKSDFRTRTNSKIGTEEGIGNHGGMLPKFISIVQKTTGERTSQGGFKSGILFITGRDNSKI